MEVKLLWREERRRSKGGKEGRRVMGEERRLVMEVRKDGFTEETMKMS